MSLVLFAATLCIESPAAGDQAAPPPRTLTPCERPGNCVSSEPGTGGTVVLPMIYRGGVEAAQAALERVLLAVPRARITERRPGFIAAEFSSRVFGFVDKAEFAFDDANKKVDFRSGATLGAYDFGVNRRRIESIRRAFSGF